MQNCTYAMTKHQHQQHNDATAAVAAAIRTKNDKLPFINSFIHTMIVFVWYMSYTFKHIQTLLYVTRKSLGLWCGVVWNGMELWESMAFYGMIILTFKCVISSYFTSINTYTLAYSHTPICAHTLSSSSYHLQCHCGSTTSCVLLYLCNCFYLFSDVFVFFSLHTFVCFSFSYIYSFVRLFVLNTQNCTSSDIVTGGNLKRLWALSNVYMLH